ncbi:MAG: hypothetical protein Q8876_01785 [Bacillota bacterium]|nr:hypothetical protein [Bacillota bacterium]
MNQKAQTHFDLQKIFYILFKYKILISCIMVLFIAGGLYNQYRTTSSFVTSQAIVGFNYTGIEKGLDPAGGKFDITPIKSPEVVLTALKSVGLDKKLNESTVVDSITVTPLVPNDVEQKLLLQNEQKKNGVQDTSDYVYYPNQYIITLTVSKAWNISNLQAQQIVNAIIDKYSDNFYNKYGYQPYISNTISNTNVKSLDYPDIATYLKNQLSLLTTYAKTKSDAAQKFRSSTTGLSFDDIYNSVSSVKKIEFDRLNALIDSYALTSDKSARIQIYNSQINTLTISMQKAQDAQSVAYAALKEMDNGKQLYYLPKNTTSNYNNDELYTSDYRIELVNQEYNQMVTKYVDSGVEASDDKRDIEDLQRKLNLLVNDKTTQEQKDDAKLKVDALVDTILSDTKKWVDLTNKTATDYYTTDPLKLAVNVVSPATVNVNINKTTYLKTGVIFAVVGFLFGLIIGAILTYINKKKNDKYIINIEGTSLEVQQVEEPQVESNE